jgi:uncharacterized cupredoxin-like copper-binding protein
MLAALAVMLAVTFAACGPKAASGNARTVAATEFKFDPATITVPAGQPVNITLQNKGTVVHDFSVEGLDQAFNISADPGKSVQGTFTPTKAGTFKIVCTQPAHEQSGMVGQLVVQ